MQITHEANYAVSAVFYLSKLGFTERTIVSTIAEEQHIPRSFLSKIISQLSVAGLIRTSRGARGGVTLAREPGAISLLEVIEAIDGPLRLSECINDDSLCLFVDECPVRSVWCEAQFELANRLKNTTFE
jgi:Rrf2 family protein